MEYELKETLDRIELRQEQIETKLDEILELISEEIETEEREEEKTEYNIKEKEEQQKSVYPL